MTTTSLPKYKLFAVGAMGTFMATLDGSILNVSLPSIAADMNADVDLVAWVVLAYSLTMVSLLIPFGAWTARRGYGFAYRFGYIMFILGSTMCALSDSIYFLVVSRVIQATGTAMFASVGPGMVTTIFPPEERGKGIGLMVMMVSAGFMAGPPLGGFILSFADWHTIFLINLPVGAIGLAMTLRYFSRLTQPLHTRKTNILSAVFSAAGMVAGIMALSLVDELGFADMRLYGLLLLSLTLLTIFFWREARCETTLIGLGIFRNWQFSTSLAAQLAHFAGLSGVLVLLPFYLERVRGYEPKQVGLYLVILPIMMFIVAPLSGRLSDRIGFKLLTGSGMAILGVGLWLLLGLNADTTSTYIISSLVVIGVGVGMFTTPNSSALMGAVTEKNRAVASGIMATNRNIGMSVGVALGTAIFSHFQSLHTETAGFAAAFAESLKPVMYVAMGWVALALIFSLVRFNRQPRLMD